jgi:hypothetical protein
MGTNTRHPAPAVPRHKPGCTGAGQSVSYDVGGKHTNETLERTRQLTIEQVGDFSMRHRPGKMAKRDVAGSAACWVPDLASIGRSSEQPSGAKSAAPLFARHRLMAIGNIVVLSSLRDGAL